METMGGLIEANLFALISKTALSVLTGAVLLLSVPAKGSSIFSIESVTGAPGSTGTFDVLLTNTGPSSQNIAAFNFELTTSDTNITFTGVSTSTTTATYIFPSSFFGPNITTFATGQSVEAGDVDATFAGTNVASGATYGLGNVSYSIAPEAVNGGIADIVLAAFPSSSLADSGGNNVPFTAESGTITAESSGVPESSTTVPVTVALFGGVWLIRRRAV
jgi:hypothetical protein